MLFDVLRGVDRVNEVACHDPAVAVLSRGEAAATWYALPRLRQRRGARGRYCLQGGRPLTVGKAEVADGFGEFG